MSGKGSSRRPATLTSAELAERWAQTFHDRADLEAFAHRTDEPSAEHVNHEGME